MQSRWSISAWGTGGPEFESRRSDQHFSTKTTPFWSRALSARPPISTTVSILDANSFAPARSARRAVVAGVEGLPRARPVNDLGRGGPISEPAASGENPRQWPTDLGKGIADQAKGEQRT
jgi:hypothetical protein